MKQTALVVVMSVAFYLSGISQPTVGLIQQNTAEDGYELFAPIKADTTYLIDKCGRLINQWASTNEPGMSVYLLSDGNLLRSGNIPNTVFRGNGEQGGDIEIYDWSGTLTWSYMISSDTQTQNHDIYPLPNGNILVVIWEAIDSGTAIAAGRNPALLDTILFSAKIEEITPVGTHQATIVWQWRLWDHLIQDFDSTKSNYGVVADHPELVNLNYADSSLAQKDWIHPNAVTYNPAFDQIILSAHNLSELWVIDHSTTTAQATTHSGGTYGHGGDLLYRWGNPQVYGRGTSADQVFYTQHNPTWIPAGYPYAGSISVFNNGQGRPGGNASSADIFTPPVDSAGNYPVLAAGQAYGPTALAFTYQASPPSSFYSSVMGSVQMLTDGNIVICDATSGDFFEIDTTGNVLWRYIDPVNADTILPQGATPDNNQVFRCTQYATNFAGFAGDSLTPHGHIELNPILTACDSAGLNTGVAQVSAQGTLMVYPNPASDVITVTAYATAFPVSYEIMNVLGEVVLSGENSNSPFELSLDGLQTGAYIFVLDKDGQHLQQKLIITK